MLGPAEVSPREGGRHRPLLRTMVGDVLRRTRLKQGRTIADVAQEAKVSMPYLSELERGLKEGSSEILAAVCDALGIELSDLLAQVGSDLADERARHDQVVRLDDFLARRAPSATGGSPQAMASADVMCLLAA